MESETAVKQTPSLPQIRFVPQSVGYARGFLFDVIEKSLSEGDILKIGRYTDKVPAPTNKIVFKSKVVSRNHAEIWVENSKFYIRDTSSSSGTFLNNLRLSSPSHESKPFQLTDGDILQLGVDYQGGTQEMFKCVKIRLEINRSWQKKKNSFRQKAMQTVQELRKIAKEGKVTIEESSECVICLCGIGAFQALFIAPCSHTYHYKCIKTLIIEDSFVCPVCRTYADLNEEICSIDENENELETPQIKEENTTEIKNPDLKIMCNKKDLEKDVDFEDVGTYRLSNIEPQPPVFQETLTVGRVESVNTRNSRHRLLPTHMENETNNIVMEYPNFVETIDIPRHTRSASEICNNQSRQLIETIDNDCNIKSEPESVNSVASRLNNDNIQNTRGSIFSVDNSPIAEGNLAQMPQQTAQQNSHRTRNRASRKSSFSRLFGDVLRAFDTRK